MVHLQRKFPELVDENIVDIKQFKYVKCFGVWKVKNASKVLKIVYIRKNRTRNISEKHIFLYVLSKIIWIVL